MSGTVARVPVCLLLNPDLPPTAKVLWLATRAEPAPASLAELATSSGLAPGTVRSGMTRLNSADWDTRATADCQSVDIPCSLLGDRRLRPQARLLFGLLQTLPAYHNKSGTFTYPALSDRVQLSAVTLRECAGELRKTGWIQTAQANRQAPVRFILLFPGDAEVALAAQRLQETDYRGEAIMKEYLSLLIASDEFKDNARPGFLVNPLTDERLELDRYYWPKVAFEYDGPQHFRTTKRFPNEKKLAMLQARDLMKEALCARRGIQLIRIQWEDLSLQAMKQKVGALLPLRDLRNHTQLIELLEKATAPRR